MDRSSLQKCLVLLQKRWGPLFHDQVINIVAYGSGVMPQTANRQVVAANTLDLLIEVRNSDIFHSELMRVSSDDYGGLSWLMGPSWLRFATQSIFPMHSNHIVLQGKKIKYSVIGKSYLREDLRTWKYLSFAGRLHKAVLPLQPYQEGFQADLNFNREAALAMALLVQRKAQHNPIRDILQNICQISYAGDIRFSARAENPQKIKNIVNYSYNELKAVYLPFLQKFSNHLKDFKLEEPEMVTFQLTPPLLAALVPLLPKDVKQQLLKIYGGPNLVQKILIGGASYLRKDLTGIVVKKNRWNSFKMATENMLTGSPIKNVQYLLAKINKKRQ